MGTDATPPCPNCRRLQAQLDAVQAQLKAGWTAWTFTRRSVQRHFSHQSNTTQQESLWNSWLAVRNTREDRHLGNTQAGTPAGLGRPLSDRPILAQCAHGVLQLRRGYRDRLEVHAGPRTAFTAPLKGGGG